MWKETVGNHGQTSRGRSTRLEGRVYFRCLRSPTRSCEEDRVGGDRESSVVDPRGNSWTDTGREVPALVPSDSLPRCVPRVPETGGSSLDDSPTLLLTQVDESRTSDLKAVDDLLGSTSLSRLVLPLPPFLVLD